MRTEITKIIKQGSSLRRRALLGGMAGLTAAFALGAPAASQAQETDWPTKPIRLVVPFPPGGSTDAVGRMLGNLLAERLGQSVIIENRGGASGTIGSNVVAKAEPDGYTLLLSGVGSNAIGYALYPQIAYQDSEFAHVSLLATGPNVLVVNPSFEAKTFKEFIDIVKANPGKYVAASSGSGSSGHLSMEMLKQVAGLDIVHAPYKGGAAAITAVMGDQVNALLLNQDNLLPHVEGGKLRALAVTSLERNPAYPDVPAIAEFYPGYSAESFFGLSAPAGTPEHIMEKLHRETVAAMNDPAIREKLEQVGFVVVANSPKEVSDFMTAEIRKWGDTVKKSGAKMD
ncbi:Bug family tripartite tricarboxylate transporter substrate binding protein [Paracandidimonas soli]|uniref:Bug family tripartite tricarboxylate transporter substrate binding protein n=1 Tax=Paracandidimonas soli TaxID=1917182 RepID=UPI003341A734